MEERITEGVNASLLELIHKSDVPFERQCGLLQYALGNNDISIRIGNENDEDETDGLWDSYVQEVNATGVIISGNSSSHGMGYSISVTIPHDGVINPNAIRIVPPTTLVKETIEQVKERVSKWKLVEFDYAGGTSSHVLEIFL